MKGGVSFPAVLRSFHDVQGLIYIVWHGFGRRHVFIDVDSMFFLFSQRTLLVLLLFNTSTQWLHIITPLLSVA